jgi:hypothetical protein
MQKKNCSKERGMSDSIKLALISFAFAWFCGITFELFTYLLLYGDLAGRLHLFVHLLRARFFPNKFEKLVSGVIDDIEESDAILSEIIRLRSGSPETVARLQPESGHNVPCGGASVEFNPGTEGV